MGKAGLSDMIYSFTTGGIENMETDIRLPVVLVEHGGNTLLIVFIFSENRFRRERRSEVW